MTSTCACSMRNLGTSKSRNNPPQPSRHDHEIASAPDALSTKTCVCNSCQDILPTPTVLMALVAPVRAFRPGDINPLLTSICHTAPLRIHRAISGTPLYRKTTTGHRQTCLFRKGGLAVEIRNARRKGSSHIVDPQDRSTPFPPGGMTIETAGRAGRWGICAATCSQQRTSLGTRRFPHTVSAAPQTVSK